MELMNYWLNIELVLPLFEGKAYDQDLIVLTVRSLANVIWCRLILLRQYLIKNEENARKQPELKQEQTLSELAICLVGKESKTQRYEVEQPKKCPKRNNKKGEEVQVHEYSR